MGSYADYRNRYKSTQQSSVGQSKNSYEQYKQRTGNATQTSVSGSGTTAQQPKSAYQRYKERMAAQSSSSADDRLEKFLKEYSSFAQTAGKDIKSLGYGNARGMLEGRIATAGKLRQTGQELSVFLQANKDQFGSDAYKQAMSEVDAAIKGVDSIMGSFSDGVKYYSKWKTEEDYNAHVAAQEAYQKKVGENAVALEQELNRLKSVQAEYNELKRKVQTLAPSQSTAQTQRMAQIYKQYGDLDTLISEKQAYLDEVRQVQAFEQKNNAYLDLMNAEDFAEKSKYVSTEKEHKSSAWDKYIKSGSEEVSDWEDPLYEYINGNQEAGSFLSNQASANYGGEGLAAIFGRVTESKEESQQMTKDEVALFNYIYATQGRDAAHEYYYKHLRSDLYSRQRQKDEEYWSNYAKENSFGASVGSIATAPLKGLSYVGQIADYLGDGKIDQNAPYNKFSYANSAIRNQVSKQIEESGNWGKVGSFAYQTGMSMADFLMSTAVSGGNATLSLAIMGTGAAADTTISAKDRGLSDDQAFWLGTAAGAVEVVTEKIGIDALFDTALLSKSAAAYVLKNALAEGAEEGLSNVMNLAADVLISKDKSEWSQTIAQYREQGLSEKEAFRKAFGNQLLSVGLDVLGGMLSGGALGGVGVGYTAVANTVNNQRVGKAVAAAPGGVEALKATAVDTASQIGGRDQRALERLAGKVSAPQSGSGLGRVTAGIRNTVNTQRVGSLYNRTAAVIAERNVADLSAGFEKNGFSPEKAASLAEAVETGLEGRQLTQQQIAMLETASKENAFRSTMAELVENQDSAVNRRLTGLGKVFDQNGTRQDPAPGTVSKLSAEEATRQNVAELAASFEKNGFSKENAASIAEVVEASLEGRQLTQQQNEMLTSLSQNAGFRSTVAELVQNLDSSVNQRLAQLQQEEAQPAANAEPAGTFQEEVQRQLKANVDTGVQEQAPDIDSVYSAAQEARDSGRISQERFAEIEDTLAYAQSDLAEGNITEAEYRDSLQAAMKLVGQPSGKTAAASGNVSATDPLVDVDRDTWQQAQRLAKALGRDIVFYNGMKGENGYYKDGTIYVNILAQDPFAQVVSHELTHSIEGTKNYGKLKKFVFTQLARSGVDLTQARNAKYELYKSYGKTLSTQEAIDAEIVAEYVQNYLLTDEQSIQALVESEPGVAKRFWNRLTNMWQRLSFKQDVRDRARLERAIQLYAKALRESRGGSTAEGTVSLRDASAVDGRTHGDELRQMREQTEADYRAGKLSDSAYDAAMDEFDRAEEDQRGRAVEQFSVGKNKRNVAKKNKARYNSKYSKVYFRENVFPPYNESQSDSHEVAERWARSDDVQTGDCCLLSHCGSWYRIQAFDDLKYGYQIMEKIAAKDYDREAKRYGTIDGHGLVQTGARKIAARHRGSDPDGNAGYRSDYDGSKYHGEDRAVRGVGSEQDGWRHPEFNRTGDRAGRRADWTGEDGSAVTSGTETDEPQFSFSGTQPEEKLPLADFMGQFAQERVKPWRQGSIVDDEPTRQAHRKGYPVIDGVQIIPFVTWVHCTDPYRDKDGNIMRHSDGSMRRRSNYGVVTGIADDDTLLVSFNNKGEKPGGPRPGEVPGFNRDDIPISIEYLEPVRGKYQATKAEWDSIENAVPVEHEDMRPSEEDLRAYQALYDRAGGRKVLQPVDLEKLPKRAQRYLNRVKRSFLNVLGDRLGVSRFADRSYLQEIVDDISMEYLNTGTVAEERLGELFDKAYAQGIVADDAFFKQYKDIKDKLRTTAVTFSERDRADIADFSDFRKRQFNRLRIVNQGGLPVDTFYDELRSMAPELFPEGIAHPADQLVRMSEVARSIEISRLTLDEFNSKPEQAAEYRAWARNDFDVTVSDLMGELHTVRRFAVERSAAAAREKAPVSAKEAMEVFKRLKKARRTYERATAKQLLTHDDEAMVGKLLRHEMELSHLDPDKNNVHGIKAVFEAKEEYEHLCKLIAEYKRKRHADLRAEADRYLETANNWKDKGAGIAYSRETMRRNIYDIIPDRGLARQINEVFFEPVHDAEAKAVRLKDQFRSRVREMGLSRKVEKGNLVSEAHAVQLLGEAEDNIRILENARGRMKHRDGKTLNEWRWVVAKLWAENPGLDQAKIRGAVEQFRKIYDELFEQMNWVRVENGYEPINYRSGYFPHFQPGASDGILAQFGRVLGIDTQVVALPTTIAGLTHTFKPGIQWFGNAQERLGFNTAYDAVEGFDKYIEGAASVICQTENIQRLRAFASQVRYRTSDEGIQKQVNEVYEDSRLTDDEKQAKIKDIYEHGKFTLSNFVAELDEYTNLLANKKSKHDRTIEAMINRKVYAFLKWWENRVGANMIAGNLTSAMTNFIPLTQAGAQLDKTAMVKGMWQTLASYKTDDGLAGMSTFLTNRRGSDVLVQSWSQKASAVLSKPMEFIDGFVSGSVVRGAYYHNRKQGMSEAEAMHQADIFAAGVMADRSKGAMPTLMQSSNPLFKAFTQFQLEVNNQFSEVFKDLPRNHREEGLGDLAVVLLQYFLGAWAFNELYEKLFGRRPALDPIGIIVDAAEDITDPDVGFGEGIKNLGTNMLGELPFSSGLTLLGFETDGGRIPASSAVPDLTAVWDAATKEGWSAEKRWKELQDELNKLSYILPPFGGNQVSKGIKGLKAFLAGGSYSVDEKGEDILQYPVYKDDPWAALGAVFRASLFGKNSLPEAQKWVQNGFDSLNAKQTAVYQAMLEAGVTDRDAYALLDELRNAKETEEASKKDVQRDILRESEISGEGVGIVYYGLFATDSERVLMDKLLDMDADSGEVVNTMMAIGDAKKLEGSEETAAKYDAIIQAALTDEEKAVFVGTLIGTELLTESGNPSQWAKFNIARESGMSVDNYLSYRKEGADIDKYLKLIDGGMRSDDAMELALDLNELEPEAGKEQVSNVQRWRTAVDYSSDLEMQLTSLYIIMGGDTRYQKLETAAYKFEVKPERFVELFETMPRYDADGNGSYTQAEVSAAIDAMRGLSTNQRAALWQVACSTDSAKKNPYNVSVGQAVLDALPSEKEETEKGLTFQEEIMRQWSQRG